MNPARLNNWGVIDLQFRRSENTLIILLTLLAVPKAEDMSTRFRIFSVLS